MHRAVVRQHNVTVTEAVIEMHMRLREESWMPAQVMREDRTKKVQP
jgi:hypothetical protein